MKVWQVIIAPSTLAFSCKVVHEKLRKSLNIYKAKGKEIIGTFFMRTRCIYLLGDVSSIISFRRAVIWWPGECYWHCSNGTVHYNSDETV